jgi:hypothetical protein
MTALPFNNAIFKVLKRRYKILIGILPTILIGVGAAIPVMINSLSSINPAVFTLVALLILFFYLAGWALNSFVARWCLRWNNKKNLDVFLHSIVPTHWYKEGGKDDYDKQMMQEMAKWQDERKTGAIPFIFLVGGLRIGGTAYATVTACLYYKGLDLDLFYFISQALIWLGLGLGLASGLFIWFYTEKDYRVFCKSSKIPLSNEN